MAFDWADYLAVAEQIIENASTRPSQSYREAAYRAAISRAYYAAFNCGRDYFIKNGRFFAHNSGDHDDVREYFVGIGEIDLADELYRLKDWRRKADYEAGRYAWSLAWVGVVGSAELIINYTKQGNAL